MLLAKFIIPLDPRTKKNSPQIVGSGSRCPFCNKFQRQFIMPSAANKLYSAQAAMYLKPKPDEPINSPIYIKYLFYMKTHRKVDESNLVESIDDLLVKEGIIEDDNSRILKHHDGTRVLYDKQNPRTEIYIYAEEEENNGQ